jgi:hypothetical protein
LSPMMTTGFNLCASARSSLRRLGDNGFIAAVYPRESEHRGHRGTTEENVLGMIVLVMTGTKASKGLRFPCGSPASSVFKFGA